MDAACAGAFPGPGGGGALAFFTATLQCNTLRLICVLIQLLYCKVTQISDAAFHIFILQTGTHRINLSTIDV